MYLLKKGDLTAKTDKDWKRDLFIKHGFELVKPEKTKKIKEGK